MPEASSVGVVHDGSPPVYDRWRHLHSRLLVVATLFLVFAGGLVTSTGSGLAVPDWPLSYGMWFPPMVGGVFYEHGHRMIAGTVGVLTAVLAAWTWAAEARSWVRRLAFVALGAVVLQALLGGLTVILLLPMTVSVAHACLGQAFFCLVVALAVVTGRSWIEREHRPRRIADLEGLGGPAATLVGVVFFQLVLGAWMRHGGAGLAIPDFPLAFGRFVPEFTSGAIAIHFAHRIGAVVVLLTALVACGRVLRRPVEERRLAGAILALVALQIGLGATTIWTGKAVLPTTAHVATGAAILGASVALALKLRQGSGGSAPARSVPLAAGARA